MTNAISDLIQGIEKFRQGYKDYKRLALTIAGKDYVASKNFELRVTEQGSFYLNGMCIEWLTTDSNPGNILRMLINDHYFASDSALKNAIRTDDINIVYKEINRLRELFKKNGYSIKIIRLGDGYEITQLMK